MRPLKSATGLKPRLNHSPEREEKLEQEGVDIMDYDKRWSRLRIRLKPGEINERQETLKALIKEVYSAHMGE